MISDEELDRLEKILICLVPKPDAKQHFISSHEKTLCDCEVLRLLSEIRRLKQENQRFREALEFYANQKTYNLFEAYPVGETAGHLGKSTTHKDNGKIAREALEGK